jgi:GNAT superfamily N-acetyltransferase
VSTTCVETDAPPRFYVHEDSAAWHAKSGQDVSVETGSIAYPRAWREGRSGLLLAVLEQAVGLTSRDLQAIAELERQVIGADGGRLKLEWGSLRGRSGDRVEDLLWWDGDRLLGFVGIYAFDASPELAGMVAPDARRCGIGSALLDAAVPLCRERGGRQPLLIVPRPSIAGKHLALLGDRVGPSSRLAPA